MSFKKIIKTAQINEFHNHIAPGNYELYFTTNELKKYASKKNNGSLLARYLLKKEIIAKSEQKLTFTEIEILNGKNNKPTLKIKNNILPLKFSFSISHTKNEVAIILVTEK